MSITEAKLSQTFHSRNIAAKQFESNYKVCLRSVFHEKHVSEVCFCLQRFESLQKVECLAITVTTRSVEVFFQMPVLSCVQKSKQFCFPHPKKRPERQEHYKYRWNGQKTQHRWHFVCLTAAKRTVDPSETPRKLVTISNSFCFGGSITALWYDHHEVRETLKCMNCPLYTHFQPWRRDYRGVLWSGLYLPHRQAW